MYINQLADGRLMHSNSWIEADGWSTDAYMLAVTYTKGSNPAVSKDMFICYGSAVRRGMTDYFSSLSKLFVIKKEEKGKTTLCIDGQPRVNATFHTEGKASKAIVNGKPMDVTYNKFGMNVKYFDNK